MKEEATRPTPSRARAMQMLYVNHRGNVDWRLVQPLELPLEFGSAHHPSEWVFRAWDLRKDAERRFAYSGILWCGTLDTTPPTNLTMTYGKPPLAPEKLFA